jgi:hypothetical protein
VDLIQERTATIATNMWKGFAMIVVYALTVEIVREKYELRTTIKR